MSHVCLVAQANYKAQANDKADSNAAAAVENKAGNSKAPVSKAMAAPAADAIAGALQKFGLRHPTRPVGVAKIDLVSSFTQASSSPAAPAATESAATSRSQAGLLQYDKLMHLRAPLPCYTV